MIADTAKLLFQCTYGSKAHGTFTDKSDTDERFVYIDRQKFSTYFERDSQAQRWDIRNFLLSCFRGIPFELETLYAPKHCFTVPLCSELQNLITENVFCSKQVIYKYRDTAIVKIVQHRASKDPKSAYHAIRILLECEHMIKNHSGPRVFVGEDKEMLMEIKTGKMAASKIQVIFDDIYNKTDVPNDLPRQPNMELLWETCQTLLKKL